jgi:hypothetical protein
MFFTTSTMMCIEGRLVHRHKSAVYMQIVPRENKEYSKAIQGSYIRREAA